LLHAIQLPTLALPDPLTHIKLSAQSHAPTTRTPGGQAVSISGSLPHTARSHPHMLPPRPPRMLFSVVAVEVLLLSSVPRKNGCSTLCFGAGSGGLLSSRVRSRTCTAFVAVIPCTPSVLYLHSSEYDWEHHFFSMWLVASSVSAACCVSTKSARRCLDSGLASGKRRCNCVSLVEIPPLLCRKEHRMAGRGNITRNQKQLGKRRRMSGWHIVNRLQLGITQGKNTTVKLYSAQNDIIS
jgi:hypothetical protein